MAKRFLSTLLVLCLLLALLPVGAITSGATVFTGFVTAAANSDGVVEINAGGNYAVSDDLYFESIVINTSEKVTLAFNDVKIAASDRPAIDCGANGDVTLILSGSNIISTQSQTAAAIRVAEGSTFKISTGTDTDGSLNISFVIGDDDISYGAAIGGDGSLTGGGENSGSVDIRGGNVTAMADYGAGVGGGYGAAGSGSSGALNIYGGTLFASSVNGVGVGGNVYCDGGSAVFTGGGSAIGTGSVEVSDSLSISFGGGINSLGTPIELIGSGSYGGTNLASAKVLFLTNPRNAMANTALSSIQLSSASDVDTFAMLTGAGFTSSDKTITLADDSGVVYAGGGVFNGTFNGNGNSLHLLNRPAFSTIGGSVNGIVLYGDLAPTARYDNAVAVVAVGMTPNAQVTNSAVFVNVTASSTDNVFVQNGGFYALTAGTDGVTPMEFKTPEITNSLCSLTFEDGVKLTTYYDDDGVPTVLSSDAEILRVLNGHQIAGNSWRPLTVSGTASSDGQAPRSVGSEVTLSAGEKSGYVFSRWIASGVSLQSSDSSEITFVMPDNDVKLTAIWTRAQQNTPAPVNTYKLTFAVNGGSAIAPLSATVYSYINLESHVPTKEGDTFDGWYQDSTLKNKISSVTLGCDTTVYAKWRGGSMGNFKLAGVYSGYSDVDEGAWYAEDCRGATLLGLMRGTSTEEKIFSPNASITLAEVIKLASVISRTYKSIAPAELAPDGTWYAPYVKYALEAGIIKASDFGGEYTRAATRAETAYILANALPASEYAKISELTPPDVADTDDYSAEINLLYAAGILRGTDGEGAFSGDNTLTRAEAAAICVRICLPDKRV